MGLMDSRKPGLSNGIAKQEGFPTSGETSANAGALPAQRAQAPYEQNRAQTNMPQPTAKPPVGGGTLNGGAVQGAQYKTQAQNMSPGVASFISIPKGISAQPNVFTAPQPSVPGATKMQMQQQPQYFAGPQPGGQSQQQQQAAPASSAQPTPSMPTAAPGANMQTAPDQPAQATTPAPAPAPQPAPAPAPAPTAGTGTTAAAPAPTADPANYDYLAEMQKMGQYYDIGGQYDLNQRSLAAETARQQNMQAWAQNQLSGRGGTAGQAQQNYLNTLAELQSDTARGQLAQQAHQTELSNRLAFNKQVADTKMQLVEMANQLGFSIEDEAFNQVAYEIANSYQGGRPVSPGEMVDYLSKNKGTTQAEVSAKQKAREQQVSDWLNQGAEDTYKSIYNITKEMSDAEFKNFVLNSGLWSKTVGQVNFQSPTLGLYLVQRAQKLGLA